MAVEWVHGAPRDSGEVLWAIEQRLAELREEERRLRAARAALSRPVPAQPPRMAGRRRPRVVVLPPAQRPVEHPVRMASADDVLALVATGHNEAVGIAAILRVRIPSVTKRLRELRGQGMIKLGQKGWEPTFKARHLNWVEFRARELIA